MNIRWIISPILGALFILIAGYMEGLGEPYGSLSALLFLVFAFAASTEINRKREKTEKVGLLDGLARFEWTEERQKSLFYRIALLMLFGLGAAITAIVTR
ncbi:hypothetical protein QEH56_23035 [Pelagicoccus enzymogenes]|uniref:hypothetical protein n=1 Tax=Pelagicoccus enzymogenes TaxID=2773457 RepID=UPI00280ED7F8|nr:hypothetical protein [Pelagicoccus enzymogenes]MDQ8201060.1 hypothetical protein [Pelagicoccus enzymogenes]